MKRKPTIKDLLERIEYLEQQLRKLDKSLNFDQKKIPLKYRKAFPKDKEEELFTHAKFKPKLPVVHKLGDAIFDPIHGPTEIAMPDNPKEYKKASERLKIRLKYLEASSISSDPQDLPQDSKHL
jgi:hypothetical protein